MTVMPTVIQRARDSNRISLPPISNIDVTCASVCSGWSGANIGRFNDGSTNGGAASPGGKLSISPIKIGLLAKSIRNETKLIYRSQRLMDSREETECYLLGDEEQPSSPTSYGHTTFKLPSPPSPIPLFVSSSHHRNVSDETLIEDTTTGYYLDISYKAVTVTSCDDQFADELFQIPEELENNIDATIDMEDFEQFVKSEDNMHGDSTVVNESNLDDFSLDPDEILELETFSSIEMDEIPDNDPKGIFAMKSIKLDHVKAKANRKSSKVRRSSESKDIPSTTETFTPRDADILRGRGGLTNRHAGNMKFRDEARNLRAEYRDRNTSRQEKFLLSQVLVNKVKGYGGRFLEKDDFGRWREMSPKDARKKASQVLREEKWD